MTVICSDNKFLNSWFWLGSKITLNSWVYLNKTLSKFCLPHYNCNEQLLWRRRIKSDKEEGNKHCGEEFAKETQSHVLLGLRVSYCICDSCVWGSHLELVCQFFCVLWFWLSSHSAMTNSTYSSRIESLVLQAATAGLDTVPWPVSDMTHIQLDWCVWPS